MPAESGGRDEKVDQGRRRARTLNNHEASRAEPGEGALERKGCQSGRHGGIDGVTTLPEC
jgi:hypothetical protein